MGEHGPVSILIALINTPSKNILKRSGGIARPKYAKPHTSLIPKWLWEGVTRNGQRRHVHAVFYNMLYCILCAQVHPVSGSAICIFFFCPELEESKKRWSSPRYIQVR